MSGPRLSITPAGAIFDRSLEPRDLQVLNLLGCYTDKAGWCRRSQVKMAKQLNCGRASIGRSMDRLVKAGWIEKKRPPWSNVEGHPSNSYMYRVVLDRDDYVLPDDDSDTDDAESHAENAMEETECPPLGTPPAQPDGHPGAQPYVGTGAQPYVGTMNDPLERPPLERERDARARERTARFIVDFEKRWPTSAFDDRQRTAYAAEALTEAEQQAALASIATFLEKAKRSHRKHVPAGWKYLEEKRWTLLEQPKDPTERSSVNYPRDSIEAKAITVLYDIARAGEALRKIWRRADGSIDFRPEMTEQLRALAQAPRPESWIELDHKQAGAWEALLSKTFVPQAVRHHPREGSRAPWPWPPSIEGKRYPSATGPPPAELSEQDMADFK